MDHLPWLCWKCPANDVLPDPPALFLQPKALPSSPRQVAKALIDCPEAPAVTRAAGLALVTMMVWAGSGEYDDALEEVFMRLGSRRLASGLVGPLAEVAARVECALPVARAWARRGGEAAL
jgi:hypothetical protein